MSRFVADVVPSTPTSPTGSAPHGPSQALRRMVSYNVIQIGLYGLFGAAVGDLVNQMTGGELPWSAWAFAALIVVGHLGVLRVDLNANILAVLLILECVAVALYDIGAFAHPAGGFAVTGALSPSSLSCRASAWSSRSAWPRSSASSRARSTARGPKPAGHGGQGHVHRRRVHGAVYAVSSWAMVVTVGAADVQKQAAENGPGVVFAGLAEHWGDSVATLANLLFLTSVFAALLSFHNGVARYLFALGRERVLPTALAGSAPSAGR